MHSLVEMVRPQDLDSGNNHLNCRVVDSMWQN